MRATKKKKHVGFWLTDMELGRITLVEEEPIINTDRKCGVSSWSRDAWSKEGR